MAESFWKIPSTENLRTPLTIMREQSTALTEQTRGALVGVAESHPMVDDKLAISLSILVPALNDYKYRILTYEQPISLYPGRLIYSMRSNVAIIGSEDEFIEHLREILSSDDVKALIGSLLVQAAAA